MRCARAERNHTRAAEHLGTSGQLLKYRMTKRRDAQLAGPSRGRLGDFPEGVAAKWAPSPYRVLGNVTPSLKVRHPNYTQIDGRHDLFLQYHGRR